MESNFYNTDFYNSQMSASKKSAKTIIPYLLSLYRPNSVLDIGCGTGEWLSVFKENNVTEVIGVDGDYVDQHLLSIPQEQFVKYDLKNELNLNRKFDLAVSLEVAEHLPNEISEQFVKSLINHSDVIMFSAAVPGQRGTYHINEQWQDFWVAIFEKFGYAPIDCIRDEIWYSGSVDWWYKQNILLFVKKSTLDSLSELKKRAGVKKNYSKIHPEMYFSIHEKNKPLERFLSKPRYSILKYLHYKKII